MGPGGMPVPMPPHFSAYEKVLQPAKLRYEEPHYICIAAPLLNAILRRKEL